MSNSCRGCENLKPEEDGNFGESRYFWYECCVTNFDNLLSFPFKNTRCRYFENSGRYIKPRFEETLKKMIG